MPQNRRWMKVAVIAVLIGSILCLHYFTFYEKRYHHAVYRMLFYVPLVMGTFWFGLKGAIYISTSVSLFYLPFVIMTWHGFSFEDFNTLLEGALYFVIAFTLAFLVERERKKHRTLLRSENLVAMGNALSEVAHDMKTPLMAIEGFAERVSKKLRPEDPNQKKLRIIIHETARLEAMVRGMLDFGKPVEIRLEKADLNDLVRESLLVARPQARSAGIKLKADLESTMPYFFLDAFRMKQALLNLMTNAIQASPAGEKVLVKTRLVDGQALVEVTDGGCGITEDNHKSVFHPFFSTKKGGTGLGLAIVKKVVEAHEGEILFHPNPERGVTFTIRIPANRHGRKESDLLKP